MVLKRTRSKGLVGVNARGGMFHYLSIHFRPFLTPKSTANWGFGTFPGHFSLKAHLSHGYRPIGLLDNKLAE